MSGNENFSVEDLANDFGVSVEEAKEIAAFLNPSALEDGQDSNSIPNDGKDSGEQGEKDNPEKENQESEADEKVKTEEPVGDDPKSGNSAELEKLRQELEELKSAQAKDADAKTEADKEKPQHGYQDDLTSLDGEKTEKAARAIAREEAEKLQREAEAAKNHYNAIYSKHPDADEVYGSKEFDEWIKSKPAYAQAAIKQALENGTSAEVVSVFDDYKSSIKKSDDLAEARKLAAEKQRSASDSAPDTLSGIQGGRDANSNERSVEQLTIDLANAKTQKEADKILADILSASVE